MRSREISVSKSKETIENFRTSLVVPVVKNPPANTGDTGLIPGWGRSHLLQGYWRLCALEAHAPQQEKLPQREVHTQQLEKAHAQQWRANESNNKYIYSLKCTVKPK